MSSRTIGIVLLVVGIILVLFGLNSSDSVADSISEGVTGRFTDKTMWYLIGGGVLAVAGASMTFLGGRNSARS